MKKVFNEKLLRDQPRKETVDGVTIQLLNTGVDPQHVQVFFLQRRGRKAKVKV